MAQQWRRGVGSPSSGGGGRWLQQWGRDVGDPSSEGLEVGGPSIGRGR